MLCSAIPVRRALFFREAASRTAEIMKNVKKFFLQKNYLIKIDFLLAIICIMSICIK